MKEEKALIQTGQSSTVQHEQGFQNNMEESGKYPL